MPGGLVPGGTARRRRAAWSVVGQVLSSASNSVMQIGLMLTMSTADFGALVIGLAIVFLALFLGRAWVGDPLVAASAALQPETAQETGRAAGHGSGVEPGEEAGAWLLARRRVGLLGLAAAGAVGLWAAFSPAPGARSGLLGLALVAPLLSFQDAYRYLFWARRRPRMVVGLDGVWLVAALAGLIVALSTGPRSGSGLVLWGWMVGGAASWALGWLMVRRSGVVTGASHRAGVGSDASGPSKAVGAEPVGPSRLRALSASQAILAVESNALPLALAAGAGTMVTAGVRAALLPFLGITTVTGALRLMALPELRAGAQRGGLLATTTRTLALYAAVAVGVGGVSLAVVLIVPRPWLGQTGGAVLSWFWLGALVVGLRSLTVGLSDTLSLAAPAGRVVGYRLATSGLDWAGALIGAAAFGVPGALGGRAVAGVAAALVWLVALDAVARERRAGSSRGGPAAVGSKV